jgi:hypothetical protein
VLGHGPRTSVGTLMCVAALVAGSAGASAGAEEEPPPDADAAVATRGDTPREVHLDLATEPMPRNAGLAVAGTEAASRALELAAQPLLSGVLRRRGGWGIASRAAWVLWIEMPLGSLGHTLNHEYGHVARLPGDVTRHDVQLRISSPLLTVEGSVVPQWPRQPTTVEKLAVQSGGWEADRLSLLRTREMLYSGETMHYVDALSYSMSKLHTLVYLLDGTQPSRLNPQTEEDWHSDPLLYARWLSEMERGPAFSMPAFQERARALRRAAYWNLADYTLLATTIGWLKGHIVDGRSSLPAPWLRLGPIGLAPSVMYTLTPIGPEHTVLTGLRIGRHSGDIHVRWSDPLQGRRLTGGGAVLRVGRPGALVQSITVDAWRNPSATIGGRIEVGGEWRRSPEDRVGLRFSVGGKSRGYLLGFSDSARIYATLGLRALF